MKIYFTAAITTISQFGKNYRAIVKTLEKMGHKVVSKHILDKDLDSIMRRSQREQEEYYKEYYKRMKKELASSDILVAEVSFPSTVHVGHELTLALEQEKPVLALHVKGKNPVLFWGAASDKFYVVEYDMDNLKDILKDCIDDLSQQMDVRFNFFISPKIGVYLDWISKHKKLPRAVFLRKLIEEHMKRNKEYEG